MPVMDLQQGSNEYNPLRTKPTTAAMNQEQKHIESSVYDPSTGKTVVSLPCVAEMRCTAVGQKNMALFQASDGSEVAFALPLFLL